MALTRTDPPATEAPPGEVPPSRTGPRCPNCNRMQAEVERLKRALKLLETDARERKRREALAELLPQYVFDLAEELMLAEPLNDQQFAQHLERIPRLYVKREEAKK